MKRNTTSLNTNNRKKKKIKSQDHRFVTSSSEATTGANEDDVDVFETLEVEMDDQAEVHPNEKLDSVSCKSRENKRFKVDKDTLYKPPTSEELNTLKETENLFSSNLLRLQIDELLAEVKLKNTVKVEEWILSLRTFLLGLPDGKLNDINDQDWIKATRLELPISQIPFKNKGMFRFLKPTDVKLVGGYPLKLSCRSHLKIDLAVKMPKACFHHIDYLNHRYHRKRAMYLLSLAHHLQKSNLVGEMKFTYFLGDRLKPVLLVKPNGKLGKKCTLSIYPYLPHDFFKMARFSPCHNNVRPSWFFGNSSVMEDVATPRYNSSILTDLTIEQSFCYMEETIGNSQGIRDGIVLFKVWAHQRHLDQGFGGFSSFIQTMYILYLLQNKILSPLMSSYQVVRNAWLHLAQSDWTERGISLVEVIIDNQPTLADFHGAFEVVFVHPLGFLNICANMSAVTFRRFYTQVFYTMGVFNCSVHRHHILFANEQTDEEKWRSPTKVRYEAEMALGYIDHSSSNGFDALFMTHVPFVQQFDHILHIENTACLKEACEKLELGSALLDNAGNAAVAILPKLVEFLQSGLKNRLRLLDVSLQQSPEWALDEKPMEDPLSSLTLGFLLDPNFSSSLLDKGPSADSAEAVSFREFWGDICEMRRFPDGSICEAVVWPGSTIADKRMICKRIVAHILSRHAFIPEQEITANYFGGELDCLLYRDITGEQLNSDAVYGTGEEQTVAFLQAFDGLAKKLRSLDGLPLNIISVHGISPVFRYTEIFPPLPCIFNKITERIVWKNCMLKLNVAFCPKWNRPQKVVLQLESSSKWPEDIEAIVRLKAAFHIKLGQLLEEQCSLCCAPFQEYVDVVYCDFVFRLIVTNQREITALKMVIVNGTVKMQNTEEALALETTTETLPKLTNVLHGLQMQYGAYSSSCRLAKRWISSQLLTDYISNICIDLIMAYIFVSPMPFTPPSCPQVGFLRFLKLLSTFDWKNSPLIVNFNGELKKDTITEIQTKFLSERSSLPAMFIATPYDKLMSSWSKSRPTLQILHRMLVLAKEALSVLESQLMHPRNDFDYKCVFRPPLDPYDVIIRLNPNQVPTAHYGVDRTRCKNFRPNKKIRCSLKDKRMPVVDYNPALMYLQELRETFGEFALFFYDHFGGLYIGVVWKPSAFEPQPFKVSSIAGRIIASDSASLTSATMITPNVMSIVEEFGNMGQGLVDVIETKTEQWTCVR